MVRVKACSLCSADISQAELSGEIGIFAKVFFDTPPSRLASHVQYRGQNHADTGCPRFRSYCCSSLFRKAPVPGGCQIDWRGKYGSFIESMQCFFYKEGRNTQAAMFDGPLLNSIRLLWIGIEVMNAPNSKISPEALSLFRQKDCIGCCMRRIRLFVHQSSSAGIQVQLPSLFFQRHASQEILYPRFDGRFGLFVDRGRRFLWVCRFFLSLRNGR